MHKRKIKPVAPPKPDRLELRGYYKKLLTADAGQRIAALVQALGWYDQNQAYLLYRQMMEPPANANPSTHLTPEQASLEDKALKCRDRGVSTTYNNEKEVSFRKALIFYEKMFASIKPPKISKYLDLVKENEDRYARVEASLSARYERLLEVTIAALKPVSLDGQAIQLKVDDIQKQVSIDPQRTTLTIQRAYAKQLKKKWWNEGLFPVLRELLDPLSRICSMEPERDPSTGAPTGQYITMASKQKAQIFHMLDNMITWAKTNEAPKRLVKLGGISVSGPTQSVVRRASTSKVKELGPGGFAKGSESSLIFELLTSQNGKWMPLDELVKRIPAAKHFLPAVKAIGTQRHSKLGKGWDLQIDKKLGVIRMVLD